MIKKDAFIVAIAAVGVLSLTYGAWYLSEYANISTDQDPRRLVVAATIFPLADIAANITGDRADVILLVPPGANEHSYTLSPGQLAEIQDADHIFYIGQGLDDHIVQPLVNSSGVAASTVAQGIQLREFGEEHDEEEADHGHDEGVDPHYWLAVPNAIRIAETIATQLERLDPDNAVTYRENMSIYTDELSMLESNLQSIAAKAGQKNFIAMHNAWAYLAEAYNFNLVFTYEPIEGRQPLLRDLNELQEVVKEYGIHTFYSEPQKASSLATTFLDKELGLNIAVLDPIGGTIENDSYVKLMQRNIETLAE